MKLAQKTALAFIRTKFRLLSLVSKKKAAVQALNIFSTPMSRHKKRLPSIFKKAEQLESAFNGITIRGYRWNYPANRKALILHGFESSVINFEHYVQPLIDKGYEVIAFDAPAHGQSGGKTITAPGYSDFVIHICEQYGPVQSFITHSFGGLALCLALEKMKHDDTYRLALIAPATESVTAINNFFKFLRIRDKEVRKEFDKLIEERTGDPPSWYSVSRAVKEIKACILWLHDRDDVITPISDVLKVQKKNYPGIRFVFTNGLGHRRIYRDEKIVKAIIDFI